MATTAVFSKAPFALVGTAYNKVGTTPNGLAHRLRKIGDYTITAGHNFVNTEVWEWLKTKPHIQNMLDEGDLKPSHRPNAHEVDALNEPASRRYITRLCAKTKSIDNDRPIFAGEKTMEKAPVGDDVASLQRQIAMLTEQVMKLTSMQATLP